MGDETHENLSTQDTLERLRKAYALRREVADRELTVVRYLATGLAAFLLVVLLNRDIFVAPYLNDIIQKVRLMIGLGLLLISFSAAVYTMLAVLDRYRHHAELEAKIVLQQMDRVSAVQKLGFDSVKATSIGVRVVVYSMIVGAWALLPLLAQQFDATEKLAR